MVPGRWLEGKEQVEGRGPDVGGLTTSVAVVGPSVSHLCLAQGGPHPGVVGEQSDQCRSPTGLPTVEF